MSQLNRLLADWTQHGLITAEQAARIRSHEAARPESNWMVRACLILGAAVIGIGVISLVAANWEDIPDGAKLLFDFAALLGLAGMVARESAVQRSVRHDAWLLGFLMACLASIGLIAQIYHAGGRLDDALIFWALISFPAVLLSRYGGIPLLWAPVLFGALGTRLIDLWVSWRHFEASLLTTAMVLPLLSLLGAGLVSAARGNRHVVEAFRFWAVLGGIAGSAVADTLLSDGDRSIPEASTAVLFGHGLGLLCAVGVLLRKDYTPARKGLLLGILALFLLQFQAAVTFPAIGVFAAAFTLALLSLGAIHLGTLGYRRLFNLLTFCVGARFLVLYFQALGGLAATGVGLIVSGVLIIALVLGWHRNKDRLRRSVEGLIR